MININLDDPEELSGDRYQANLSVLNRFLRAEPAPGAGDLEGICEEWEDLRAEVEDAISSARGAFAFGCDVLPGRRAGFVFSTGPHLTVNGAGHFGF